MKGKFQDRIKALVFTLSENKRKRIFFAEREFRIIVHDILSNKDFLSLRGIFHHNSSIYDHSVSVAYLSYRIARALSFDYISAARGALLHDFFMYNWRDNESPAQSSAFRHGRKHPKIALANARSRFDLNKTEEEIIVKHMWPLTLSPPMNREALIVSFVDKFCATREYSVRFRQTVKRKGRSAAKRINGRTMKKSDPTGKPNPELLFREKPGGLYRFSSSLSRKWNKYFTTSLVRSTIRKAKSVIRVRRTKP